ncbi:MAG TPA: hypothetical protein VHY32_03290 [Caulobacteraceae bacterium]|jgi:hypothetical protein|nr:hypothetical protein [Caulobacteraceae bacterium]
MRRRILLIAVIASLTAGAVQAAEAPKPQDEQAVTLSPVALPIVVDGRLANYVFATVKVLLKPSADQFVLRDKEPYFRDALVRAAHRTPFVLRNDYNHIDTAKLRAVMMREAIAIAGPNAIRDIVVVDQTPQHAVPSPHPG